VTIPDPSRGFDSHANRFQSQMLQKARPELLESDYLAIETAGEAAGAELWRISLRLGALNDVDYGEFVKTLRGVVEPVVTSYRVRNEVLQAVVRNATQTNDRIVGNVLVLGHSNPNATTPSDPASNTPEGGKKLASSAAAPLKTERSTSFVDFCEVAVCMPDERIDQGHLVA
jgi:hypothetical protein